MIRAERIEKIKSLAKGRDIITWEELQDCLQVSKATVQRDANILCNASVLRKTRGGVIFIQEPDAHELSNAAREVTNKEAKRRIAEAALEFVQEVILQALAMDPKLQDLKKDIQELYL